MGTVCWGCGLGLLGAWAVSGDPPCLAGGPYHTWVLSPREQKSGCLLQVTQRGSGDGAYVRCHRVVSSPRGWGKSRCRGTWRQEEGPAVGWSPGWHRSCCSLAAPGLWAEERPPFRAELVVPLPLLAAAASSPGAWGGPGGWTAARASGFQWSQRPAQPLPLCLVTLWSLGTVSWARMLGCGFSFCPTTYPRGAVEKLNQLLKNKNKPAACLL